MARSYGKLLARCWSDPDWTSLTVSAQRLYMLLLSQPKLSLVGVLDFMPQRWAKLAAGCDLPALEAALAELEAGRFIVVDRDTDELLVRSLLKNDGVQTANKKVVKGVWSAWNAVQSSRLRHLIAENAPDELHALPGKPDGFTKPQVADDISADGSADRSADGSTTTTTESETAPVDRPFGRSDDRERFRIPREEQQALIDGVGGARASLRAVR